MAKAKIDRRLAALEAAQPVPAELSEVDPAVWVHWLAHELREPSGVMFDRDRAGFIVVGCYGDRGARRLASALNRMRQASPSVLFFPALTSEVDYVRGEIAAGRLRCQFVPVARMISTLACECDQTITYPVARAVCVALDQTGDPYPRDLAEYSDMLAALRPFCFDLVMYDETPLA